MFGQELGTYQTDSIYKANKVKSRLWYSGTNKKLGIITSYDLEGRLSEYKVFMNLGGTERTTHFNYDSEGNLVSQIDSIKNGKPDKKELKRLKKMGINPSMILGSTQDKPPIEVSKYDLTFSDGELTKCVKYNSDKSLDYESILIDNGETQIKKWYKNNSKLYRHDTTHYMTKFLKDEYSGWYLDNDGYKINWSTSYKYQFENGVVQSFESTQNLLGGLSTDTGKYYYNENGLLTKVDGRVLEQFEYTYHE